MKTLEKQTSVFRSLADPTRVRIIKMLQVRPLCVCEITDVLGLSSSTVSEHLSVLKDAGLVLSQKQGKLVFHKINFYSEEPGVSAAITMVGCLMNEDPVISADKTKAKKVDCREILARKS